ncbi:MULTISPECIES: DUF1573 domain-containing protein [Flavobacterium]|nr:MULTISPECIES: DUF1573 domain-containing protein [Flavobacterium]PZO34600.1 MAG: DUF1573 domain-containing protein [Flavobacteriaceae bacterium]THD30488.1 MAG: DUF1573 domain-containing protein [Flavobacterium johnsoniae]KQS45671.1 hypothetical protein ASG38_15725 [Flavobacterium sp. Leaf359]MBL7867567.1 DUF1573 domain-containing protein [Flavobacterium lindanitolerans]MDQ7962261.1 DUF1573 domain-containing protein [Flavobacterium lindanitolerans]
MKKILSLFAVMMFAVSAMAQTGPKIEFKEETIDYGTVTKGEDNGLRVFEFKNIGDAPLIINDVKSSCGCTVPTKPQEPIMPGKTGKIEVQYNMNPGPISKTITVQSNAVNKDSGIIPLRIKGNVIVKEEVNLMEKKKTLPSS